MLTPAENFYAAWRTGCRALALRDGDGAPPEKLLQTIWLHQRLKRGGLRMADGRAVRVLHPGFLSNEGGPDFRGAVLKFGGEPPVSGDVEVDLQPAGWRAHGHDSNPAFRNVILHVVWDEAQSPKSKALKQPDILALKDFLDAPLTELALALENESGLPANLRGRCSAPLRELSAGQLEAILRAAAGVRLHNKAAAILARARSCGWEQALWENLFRALGYKHNVWPMQHLAETRSQWHNGAGSVFETQARLLGVSGLLPDELTRAQWNSASFLRRAWDCWWRDRDALAEITLPRAVWKFHGLRPANHPQRRLALASHWLTSENLAGKIESWIAAEIPDKSLAATLNSLFQVKRDDFWSWHWTFQSARFAGAQPLLGLARTTDLAVNVVLPWLWIRARQGGNEKIAHEVERRFFAWPAAEDNSTLKLARQRLLGSSGVKTLKGAAQQQGLMQIVRDFCEHSNAVCADCRFPDLVRGWQAP